MDNTGKNNSGNRNSGYYNSGDRNSGYYNSGDRNSGNYNSGYYNSGYCNSGNCNSGNRNSGYYNSGDRNSGNYNSGYYNSGYCNSGDRNSGNYNSGYCNSGNCNSGNYNSGNYNSGYLNTNQPTVRMFNRQTVMSFEELDQLIPNFFYFDNNGWVESEHMTDEEKKANPEHETTGGFLRVKEYKQAWRDSWNDATDGDRRKVLDLPNWDNAIFEEITGINVEKELENDQTIEVEGKTYRRADLLDRIKELEPVE